ncbi:MAG: hypothetical protein JWP88_2055 [Flaviaesturariibacter sp.]|nr:hypothetical protein [Flaviaesturariibacter sp.]
MKKPKVLLLGYNFASVMNSLAIGFEEIGLPYKAISFDRHISKINQYSHVEVVYPGNLSRRQHHMNSVKGLARLGKYLAWCDIIHVFYDTSVTVGRKELALIKRFSRKKFISFLGSDIRNPEISLRLNPYFPAAFHDPGYEYKHESTEASQKIQADFSAAGFKAIHWGTDLYNDPKFFPEHYNIPLAAVNHYGKQNKEQSRDNVLIVHSPSAPVAKGTTHVLKAIEELQHRNITNFRFQLLKDITNDEYQKYLADADILIDQMIWGGYGIASVQALALGKVVISYLLPQRLEIIYGKECPVVDANIDNLADVLEGLIGNYERRAEISRKGIAYYYKVHSPVSVAKRHLDVYTGAEKPVTANVF